MTASPPSSTSGPSISPPEVWEPLQRVAKAARRPLERFLHIEAASAILLLLAAAAALIWANSPWNESYTALWHTMIGFSVGGFRLQRSLEWLVNDDDTLIRPIDWMERRSQADRPERTAVSAGARHPRGT